MRFERTKYERMPLILMQILDEVRRKPGRQYKRSHRDRVRYETLL